MSRLRFGLVVLPWIVACASEPPPAAPLPPNVPPVASAAEAAPAPASAPAIASGAAPAPASGTASASAAAPAGALDLSSAEAARKTIRAVLLKGDKEAFRRCVTKKTLAKHEKGFDDWFAIWTNAAKQLPDAKWSNIVVVSEDGSFRLDEN
jgi:hypothetical protein